MEPKPLIDDPDKTQPFIEYRVPRELPAEPAQENPLEELLTADERVRELQRQVDLLNLHMANKTFEYGGLKVLNPKFDLNLELSGVDENGMQLVVPRDQVKHFLESVRG